MFKKLKAKLTPKKRNKQKQSSSLENSSSSTDAAPQRALFQSIDQTTPNPPAIEEIKSSDTDPQLDDPLTEPLLAQAELFDVEQPPPTQAHQEAPQPVLVIEDTVPLPPPSQQQQQQLPPPQKVDSSAPTTHAQSHQPPPPQHHTMAPTASLLDSIILLSKAIVGAGSAALPFATARLGIVFSLSFLVLIAFMTHFSIDVMTQGALVTGHASYPAVVKSLLGPSSTKLLELSLVLRCAGLMIVYMIIAADILAGGHHLPGLLCDVLKVPYACDASASRTPADHLSVTENGHQHQQQPICARRDLVLLALTIFLFAPLVTPRRLSSSKTTSIIGMVAVAIWALVTIMLSVLAVAHGDGYPMSWWPDVAALDASTLSGQAVKVLATLPVIATAYTCQMTVYFVMKELKDFNEKRMSCVSSMAVSATTIFFLAVSLGSYSAFGSHVPADVLEVFSSKGLSHIHVLSHHTAHVLGTIVRLGFLLSVVANFPIQMLPFRESLSNLLFGSNFDLGTGPLYYIISYSSLLVFYFIAMNSASIWTPLQLVGATAGALIAFVFPAMIGFKAVQRARASFGGGVERPMYWILGGWMLVLLGVVQCITGIGAIVLEHRGK